jgi:predicted hotdog family 3-hydroxylacyl-ACP dehydratase
MSEIEIPEGSPFFSGHFPGSPILPGIAHLALAFPGVALLEVRSLKLRRPVGPGDRLDVVAAAPGPDGVARFEIRRGEEMVSQGVVRLVGSGAETTDGVPDPGVEAPPSSAFPPPETLIPHAAPALLVRSVEAVSPEGIAGLAVFPADHPLAEGGRVPSFLGLEAAAQAAAVLEALERSADAGGPRIGYLVGIRDAVLRTPDLPVGRAFRVTARLHGSAPPLSMYQVTLEGASGEILAGTISTYIAAG